MDEGGPVFPEGVFPEFLVQSKSSPVLLIHILEVAFSKLSK